MKKKAGSAKPLKAAASPRGPALRARAGMAPRAGLAARSRRAPSTGAPAGIRGTDGLDSCAIAALLPRFRGIPIVLLGDLVLDEFA